MAQHFNVAVIGAGPSGLYTAQELVSQSEVSIQVDIFERLPTPFGLIRYGVAPDHAGIKSIADTIAKVFTSERVRFIGSAQLGRDFSRADVVKAYDAVVYATGSDQSMTLNIPGEELPGSQGAAEWVTWYSGHPDAGPQSLVGVETVVIVGAGNVALDVARMLSLPADKLTDTDIPDPVLAELAAGQVQQINILCRRGVENARFTTKEFRELLEQPNLNVEVVPADWDPGEGQWERRVDNNIAALRDRLQRGNGAGDTTLRLWFSTVPEEVLASEDGSRVGAIRLARTRTEADGTAIPTGETTTIPCDLVLRSVGYRSTIVPDVPHDHRTGRILVAGDRVVGEDGAVCPGEYAVGWAKRGPDGVIGTNKKDARATATTLLEDLAGAGPKPEPDFVEMLAERGVATSSFEDWRRIDQAEAARGAISGRTRVKLSQWHEMLEILARNNRQPTETSGQSLS